MRDGLWKLATGALVVVNWEERRREREGEGSLVVDRLEWVEGVREEGG